MKWSIIEKKDIKTPGKTLKLITTGTNWLGLSTAVIVFIFVEFGKFLMMVPILNVLLGSLFAVSDIFNTFLEYKLDSSLIQSVEKIDGNNKEAALTFLHSRRRINCMANVLKALSYMAFAAIPLIGLTNPVSSLLMTAAVATWVTLLCIQKGTQMIKARHYRLNRLFVERPESQTKENNELVENSTYLASYV